MHLKPDMGTDSFILHIDSMAYGGRGVGRRGDGKVAFAAMTIPEETLRACVIEEHKSYVVVEVEELLEASPYRVSPPCPIFSLCGGCDWQHIAYQKQIAFKEDILLSQIRAKCPKEAPVIAQSVASGKEYGYRCHAIVQCIHDGGFGMGFFRKQSNSVVPFERCPILNEHTQITLSALRDILADSSINSLDSIEIHAPQDEVLVRIMCRGRPCQDGIDIISTVFSRLPIHGLSYITQGAQRWEKILGKSSCSYEIHLRGTNMMLSTAFGGFIQANTMVNQALVTHVFELARGSRRILDLYSGNGNFSIPLALEAKEVFAVEGDSGLVALGRRNARKNRLKNVRFFHMEAGKAVASLVHEEDPFDVVVLDPPREGAKEVVQTLARMRSDRIIYISCNPSTLSRDLAILTYEGYKLKGVRLFDMFPQTYHIESVSYLER
jgi:23S rRNA (uracil1939-C5)-methyltransferase